MDDRGEIPDPTHRILRDAVRYGIGAWVLFLGRVGYYFHLGSEIPFHDEGQSMALGFTGFLGFVIVRRSRCGPCGWCGSRSEMISTATVMTFGGSRPD